MKAVLYNDSLFQSFHTDTGGGDTRTKLVGLPCPPAVVLALVKPSG